MTIVSVRVNGTGRLAVIRPQEIPGGATCFDHDQRPVIMVSDIGHAALIRRADNTYHWRARALITPAH